MGANFKRLTVALCSLLVALGCAAEGTVAGRIVGVLDGDTIDLLDADHRLHRIRLEGIDAPEKAQPYGAASKRALSDMAFHHDATAECHKTDRYRREVCRVMVGEVDVCLAQVEAGMAWHFKRYAREQPQRRRTEYAQAEEQARAERRGLWVDAAPTPPWDWRQHRAGVNANPRGGSSSD